jgi:hypothetical protein
MGTRSTVKFYENGGCVASVYQQYDGYIRGVGLDLAKFLSRKKIINGFGSQTMDEYANGVGCLAAQYIAEIKTQIGNVYMTTEKDIEEYNYKVTIDDDMDLTVVVEEETYGLNSEWSVIETFSGTVAEFLEYCESE